MDLLASVATGIIEVNPNLRLAAEVMDQFLEKQQQQQTILHHQLSQLESVVSEPLSLQMKLVL